MAAKGPPGEGWGRSCAPSTQHRSCRDREVTSSAPGKQGEAQEGQESSHSPPPSAERRQSQRLGWGAGGRGKDRFFCRTGQSLISQSNPLRRNPGHGLTRCGKGKSSEGGALCGGKEES